jgi:MFS family permease
MLPMTTVMLVAGPLAGTIAMRRGAKLPFSVGALFMVCGLTWLVGLHGERWEMVAGSAIIGCGVGFAFASMANLIVEVVPPEQTGEATGMNTIMRTVGGALGAQISASILAQHVVAGGHTTSDTGFTAAFAVTALVVNLGVFVSLAIPATTARSRAAGA